MFSVFSLRSTSSRQHRAQLEVCSITRLITTYHASEEHDHTLHTYVEKANLELAYHSSVLMTGPMGSVRTSCGRIWHNREEPIPPEPNLSTTAGIASWTQAAESFDHRGNRFVEVRWFS